MKISGETHNKKFEIPEDISFYYNYYDIKRIIDEFLIPEQIVKTKGKKPNIEYFNVPCAFDIETTSTEVMEQKHAFMYCWQMCLNGAVIFGRRWDEFIYVLETLQKKLQLNDNKRLIIYVHNLGYEFQFMRKRIKWNSVFSLAEREPVKALSSYGVEFRCSYILSGYGLSKVADNLLKYKIKKMVGDLDYSLIRNEKTKMTKEEMQYCINDVLVVSAYIQESIEANGDITQIPLTKTGYVRRLCLNACLPSGTDNKKQYYNYYNFIKDLTLDPEEYQELKRAYQGGFTHANSFYVGEVIDNVGSYDFTSSYPAVLLSEKFPMTKGRYIQIDSPKRLMHYLKNYCCLFDIAITDVVSSDLNENFLSYSKCWNVKNAIINNGRIASADYLETTMTEQDFYIFLDFYQCKNFKVANFIAYDKGYLPKPIIETILKLYEDKTMLKGVEGKEAEYLSAKENVNSVYGMMVTDPCRDEILYNDNDVWGMEHPDLNEALERYNNSRKRFLFYGWGVWCTAYARRNLSLGIKAFGNDYIYSDTDSIKARNINDHIDFINDYNEKIVEKINNCLSFRDLNPERSRPLTIKGDVKQLGVWDYEGMYDSFKTLGAKRYMIYKDNKYNITISGLNKKSAVPYIVEQAKIKGIRPFDIMEEGMYIPPEKTGKNTHSYLDYRQDGMIIDYQGNVSEYHELSSVHLSGADYTLSLAVDFLDYLKKVKTKRTGF